MNDTTTSHESAIQLLDKLRRILITASTGTAPGTSTLSYPELYSSLTYELEFLGLDNPIPYEDLADWHGKWSSGDLPSYDSRREHIRQLVDPVIRYLQAGTIRSEAVPEPIGWDHINQVQDKIRSRLTSGSGEADFQSIGLLCREVLITVAQTVFDTDRHPPLDEIEVSTTDTKRMLDRYLNAELPGSANKAARKYARASVDLANKLQHRRTATFRDAALCAQANFSVVNFIAIVAHNSS